MAFFFAVVFFAAVFLRAVVFFFGAGFFRAAALRARASALRRRASASASTSPDLVTLKSRSSSAPQFQQRSDFGRRSSREPHSGQGRSFSGGLFTARSHSGYRSHP